MSGRFVLGSARRFSPSSLVALVALVACLPVLSAAPALAQSAADKPEAPSSPAAQPVAEPAPAEPAPSSPSPPTTEPTPAPTPTPAPAPVPEGVAPTAPAPEGAAPSTAAPPAGSAAFAPLPAEAPPATQPPAAAKALPVVAVAAAPAAAPQPAIQAAPEPSNDGDDSSGLLGPFRIGVLVGSGLPEVANFGAQLKLTRFVGIGVNVGLIPTVRIKFYGDAAQKYQEYDLYGHIYPFGGSFFLGSGIGYAQIDGTIVQHVSVPSFSTDVTSDATVRTMVLTPQVGFLKIFPVGFAVGLAVGAQIPIAPSQVEFNTAAPNLPPALAEIIQREYIDPNDEKVKETLEKIGRTPLPTLSFKIGWFL